MERRARRLASWAGSSAGAARERCARLTQVAALLALEQAAHARDALPAARRLAAPEARDVLARRYHTHSSAGAGVDIAEWPAQKEAAERIRETYPSAPAIRRRRVG